MPMEPTITIGNERLSDAEVAVFILAVDSFIETHPRSAFASEESRSYFLKHARSIAEKLKGQR